MTLEPKKKDRKKFDIDLAYGKVREESIKDMLQNKKIEVKSERDVWQKTGNIAIEYESYGKPSGIAATEAEKPSVKEIQQAVMGEDYGRFRSLLNACT